MGDEVTGLRQVLEGLVPGGEVRVETDQLEAHASWKDGVVEETVLAGLRRELGTEVGSSSQLMRTSVTYRGGWRVHLQRSVTPLAAAVDVVAGLVLEGCSRCEGTPRGPLPRPWAPAAAHPDQLGRRDDLTHLRAALGAERVQVLQEAAEVLAACGPGWVGTPGYQEVTAHLEACRERLCEVGHLEGLLQVARGVKARERASK